MRPCLSLVKGEIGSSSTDISSQDQHCLSSGVGTCRLHAQGSLTSCRRGLGDEASPFLCLFQLHGAVLQLVSLAKNFLTSGSELDKSS